ncbi:hypothetical protein EVAR_97881_1 [Eumeta japonica]|uniref:Uncharacterized protein n=1 Tax=Eumeta variegata TaxID=151549 RepID=A0A4C1WHH7_EUMVA|nr:hypothetical protein EVAR_97881_1 [Eumeta japonica]
MPDLMVSHMPVCFDHTAHSMDVFVVHSGGRTITTKFVTEGDTTVLEFCEPIINSRLAWCFICKSSSKSSEVLLICQITFKTVENHINRREIGRSFETRALAGNQPVPPASPPDNKEPLSLKTQIESFIYAGAGNIILRRTPGHERFDLNETGRRVLHADCMSGRRAAGIANSSILGQAPST